MESEKRLIDANALIKQFDDCNFKGFVLKRLIEMQPTVDAVEVVHGRWVGTADGYADGEPVYDVWNCSECGYCIDDGTDDPEQLPNFCPNCGAKMDEGSQRK